MSVFCFLCYANVLPSIYKFAFQSISLVLLGYSLTQVVKYGEQYIIYQYRYKVCRKCFPFKFLKSPIGKQFIDDPTNKLDDVEFLQMMKASNIDGLREKCTVNDETKQVHSIILIM